MDVKLTVHKGDMKLSPETFKLALHRGLTRAMLYAEAESKKRFNTAGNLHVRSGRLRASIKGTAKGMIGSLGTSVIYGAIHERGGTITAKRVQYLKFKINGRWRSAKQVIIPPRPFLMPAIEGNKVKLMDIIKAEILGAFE